MYEIGKENMQEKKTVVRGIRASDSFWGRCDEEAHRQNTTRNKLIISIINEYLDKKCLKD